MAGSNPTALSRQQVLMLSVLAFGVFLASGTSGLRSPFLLDMAHELEVDLLAIANLMALMSVPWGIVSIVAGTASDRVGRKPILVAGILLMGITTAGAGLSQTYLATVVWVLLCGLCGGCFMGTVFATVTDQVPAASRGQSLSWVMTGQSLSLVLGIPAATLVGAYFGWRGAHLAHAGLTLLIGVLTLLVVPARRMSRAAVKPAAEETTTVAAPLRTILTPRILCLLCCGTIERICFAVMTVYLATFLIETYGVALDGLAVALLLVTLGNLLGNLAGGQLADRAPSREVVYALALGSTAVTVLPLFWWTPGLELSIILGFGCNVANAIGRPSYMAMLSSVPEKVRGSVLGLNVTFASFGWIIATAIGGWFLLSFGFGGLGAFCAVASALGLVVFGLSSMRGTALLPHSLTPGKPGR